MIYLEFHFLKKSYGDKPSMEKGHETKQTIYISKLSYKICHHEFPGIRWMSNIFKTFTSISSYL